MRSILGVILALTLAVPMFAAGPQPITGWLTSGDTQNPIEQESDNFFFNNCGFTPSNPACDPASWVVNPWLNGDRCAWDVDDHVGVSGFGYLNAGGSAAFQRCYVADDRDNYGGDDKIFDVRVFAPAKTISVRLTDSQGNIYNPIPVANGNGWVWIVCAREHFLTGFGPIANSNGGTGLRVDGTLTVSAIKKTSNISVYFSTWGWLSEFTTTCQNPNQPGG